MTHLRLVRQERKPSRIELAARFFDMVSKAAAQVRDALHVVECFRPKGVR